MKLRLTSFVLLVALVSAFIMVPQAAAAQTLPAAPAAHGPLTSIPLNGTLSGAVLNITKFIVSQDGSTLEAEGNLTSATGAVQGTFTTPVTIAQGTDATCNILTLTLGPIHLDLLGLVIDIPNQITITITAQSGPGNLLGNLLCAIAGLLNGNGTLSQIASLLNAVTKILNFSASNPLANVPATGALVTGGTLSIKKFVVGQDGTTIMANGVLKDGSGQVLSNFTTSVVPAVGQTCNILNLTIAPIHLDLLGLVIDTSTITLNITAQSGPGNLLGNLLCAIAGLLNGGGSVATIVKDLNAVLFLTH